MPGLTVGVPRFGDDDGSAEPRITAALAAFASGQGSEHAAVESLATSRLLVPIVAAVAADPAAVAGTTAPAAAGPGDAGHQDAGGHHASEMSIPTLIGRDGRRAVPAFTSLDTLARWRLDARPVPTEAADVWFAAVADGCAVVVDVAGPVPIAVDGARLAALAAGDPVPLPYQDPDVQAAVQAAAAGVAGVTGIGLDDGAPDSDLSVHLRLAGGPSAAVAEQTAGAVAQEVMSRLGGRLRRGITITADAEAPLAGEHGGAGKHGDRGSTAGTAGTEAR